MENNCINEKKQSAMKIVSAAIIGMDFKTVVVNGKAYVVTPPTIHRIAGAGYYLSDLEGDGTVGDMVRSMKDVTGAASALSFLIRGDLSLKKEFGEARIDEVTDALCEALSLMSPQNFSTLSALARNVARLTAKQG